MHLKNLLRPAVGKRMRSARIILLVSVLGLVPCLAASGGPALSTICTNRISGTWNFGSSPSACNVSPLQSPGLVKSEYGVVLFDDAQISTGGRARYMSEMYPVLRDMAKYYIHRRNPQVSLTEEEGFATALFTLANQESVWTHYRLGKDGIVRYMRGDNLHGFGIMQIDDRSHQAAVKTGKGTDLVDNMVFGLDIFYSAWVKSAKAACVSSPGNYKDRARTAWSAYNGGMGSLCRWTNANSKFAIQDREFNSRYNAQAWRHFVADLKAPSQLDVGCLAEGVGPCGSGKKLPLPQVVKLVEAPLAMASLGVQIPYRFMRECAGQSCAYIHGALRAGSQVAILSESGAGWVQVQSQSDGQTGWIKRSELSEVEP